MKGEPISGELLDTGERMSPEELGNHQLAAMRRTLQHAFDNAELYRRKFDEAGLPPGDCRSLSDLARFFFTTNADLRDTYPFACSRRRWTRCGGSTPPAVPPAVPQCVDTKDGLHIWEDHFYPEMVDPLADQVLPHGESG